MTRKNSKIDEVTVGIITSRRSDELIESIVERACDMYDEIGQLKDFCLQVVGPNVIVFGKTNRVRWSAKHGFTPEVDYCTTNFLKSWCNIHERF